MSHDPFLFHSVHGHSMETCSTQNYVLLLQTSRIAWNFLRRQGIVWCLIQLFSVLNRYLELRLRVVSEEQFYLILVCKMQLQRLRVYLPVLMQHGRQLTELWLELGLVRQTTHLDQTWQLQTSEFVRGTFLLGACTC